MSGLTWLLGIDQTTAKGFAKAFIIWNCIHMDVSSGKDHFCSGLYNHQRVMSFSVCTVGY